MPLDNLAVWTIPPDWQSGITETLEFLTTVLPSPNGAEQRYAYRLTPRRSFEMTFRPARGPARTLFDMFVERASGSDIYLPLWHDFNRLTHPAAPGADRLNVGGTNDMEYADCEGVFIQGGDPFEFEIAEVASVDPSQVLLTAPIAGTWSTGLRVFPLQRARIETQPQAARKADRAAEVRIKFSLLTPNPTSAAVVLSKYAGYPVLERQPNNSTDLSYQYDRIMAELDNQSGRRTRVDINAWGSTIQQFTWLLHRRDDHQWMRAFCYQLNGRQYPVLVPTFFADLDVVAPIVDNSLTVTRCGYTEFGGPFRNRELIQISLYSGRNYYARITGAALVGDGSTERLVLDTTFDQVIQPSDIHRVSFLSICRLDQDAIEIVHETDSRGAATATTVFRSLPQDRLAIPPMPRYLYFQVEITNTAQDSFGGGGYTCCVGLAGLGGNLLNPVLLDHVLGNNPELDQMYFWTLLRIHNGGAGGWKARPGACKVVNLPDQMVIGVAIDRIGQWVWTHNPTFEPDEWFGGNADYNDPVSPVTGAGGYPIGSNPNCDPDTAPDGGPGGCGITGNVYLLLGAGHNAGQPYPSMKLVLDPAQMHGAGLPDGFSPATPFLKMNREDSSPYLSISTDGMTVTCLDIPGGNQPTAFCRSIGSITNAV